MELPESSATDIRWTRRRLVRATTLGLAAPILGGAVTPSHAAESGIRDITWRMGPPMPRATKGQAQGVLGTSIVFACGPGYRGWVPGRNPSERGRHKEAFILDTRTMTYDTLPDAPVGVRWPQAAVVGDDFYLLTGWVLWPDTTPDGSSKRMFRLSRRSGGWKWEAMPSLRIGRFIPGVAAAGSTIVVLGGQAAFGATVWGGDFPGVEINAVEAFDTAAPERGWRDLPPIPGFARESMATAAIGRRVYVFGGFHTKYAEARGPEDFGRLMRGNADAYVLDLDTLRWRRLPDPPIQAQGWEAIVYRDRYVVMVGGVRNYPVEHPYRYAATMPKVRAPNFEVLVFDTVEETYRTLPTPIPPYEPKDPKVRAAILRETGFDFSRGVYRLCARLSRIGTTLYLCGAEVRDPANVTDEVVIGTIHEG